MGVQIDIVIPVYNEGKSIIDVMESLRRFVKTPFRVLICYDREDDNTLEAISTYSQNDFEIVRVKNGGRGVHSAVVSGFEASQSEAVVVFPGDDTFNAGIIDRMFEKFKEGCEIVAASRFMEGGRMEGCPWLKALIVRTAAFTLYHFAGLPTHDSSNGFRLFSRRVLDNIEIKSSEGFTYSIELLVKCHRSGWEIGEVPALWFERAHGKSRFRVLKWLPAYLRWYAYAFLPAFVTARPK